MGGNLHSGGSHGGRGAHVSSRSALLHHVSDRRSPSFHVSNCSTDRRLSQGELVDNPLLLIAEPASDVLPQEDTSFVRNACGDGCPTKGKKKLIEASGSVSGVRLLVPSSRRMSKDKVVEPLSRDIEALPKLVVGSGIEDSSTGIEEEQHRMLVNQITEALSGEDGSADEEDASMEDCDDNGEESELEMNEELDDSLTLGKS